MLEIDNLKWEGAAKYTSLVALANQRAGEFIAALKEHSCCDWLFSQLFHLAGFDVKRLLLSVTNGLKSSTAIRSTATYNLFLALGGCDDVQKSGFSFPTRDPATSTAAELRISPHQVLTT
jgi:hypothetical protein